MENQGKEKKNYFINVKTVHTNPNSGAEMTEWEKVEVSEEYFKAYYRPINAYRKRMQEHGQCICPARYRLMCDMDCWTCPYHTGGDAPVSLDETIDGEDGNGMSLYDSIPSGEDIEDSYIKKDETARLRKRIEEIMPLAITIGELRMEGLSDSAIAERINVPRTTFLSQLKKLTETLSKEGLIDIF